MPLDEPHPWVGLRFEIRHDGVVRVLVADERGRWLRPPPQAETEVPLPPPLGSVGPVVAPFDLRLVLSTPSWGMPVFVDAPRELQALPLEAIATAVVDSVAPAGVASGVVRWRRRLAPCRPFRLPLQLTIVGADPVADDLAKRIEDFSWFGENQAARRLGLELRRVSLAGLATAAPADVVFTTPLELPEVQRRLPATAGPAVVVVLAGPMDHPRALGAVTTSHSLVWLPHGRYGSAAVGESFVEGLVHDEPLHAAVQSALASSGLPSQLARVDSDPEANFGAVRLSDAVAPFAERADRLELASVPGDVEAFLARLDEREAQLLGDRLRRAAERGKEVLDFTASAHSLKLTFEGERTGLVPLSEASLALKSAERTQLQVDSLLAELARDPEAAAVVARHQVRVVDLALTKPPAVTPIGTQAWIEPGAAYRLCVHIGPRRAGSLIRDAPPIDPLLPAPPDALGHELDVVVFGHDFTVTSEARQTLRLPPLGPSKAVWFDLQAPGRTGPARARVAIYYRDRLIQSFLIRAAVGELAELYADLEFSETKGFGNVPALQPRALSIAVNEDPGGASHRLMWKRGPRYADVPLEADQVKAAMKRFRETLTEATLVDGRRLRFPLDGPIQWDQFDHYARRLAREGHEAFAGAFQAGDATVRAFMREVGAAGGEPIQVVLHSQQAAFPWTTMYDLFPPDTDEPVCLGGHDRAAIEQGEVPLERRCSHLPGDTGFCIYGFWGVRHQLEYQLESQKRDAIVEVARAPEKGPVRLVLGDARSEWVQPLLDLKTALGDDAVQIVTPADPLELFGDAERPSVLVLVGHSDETEGPAIAFLGGAGRLKFSLLNQRLYTAGDWKQPNTIVLLMACASSATTPEALISMVRSFTSAPAGAVVGTEAQTVPTIVSRFAADVTEAIWAGETFGAAMTKARRRLLHRGNPLGFAFAGYGNVDLRLAG